MSLGKRTRPAMKRNTSMTEFTLDLINGGVCPPSAPYQNPFNGGFSASAAAGHRRSSADFHETAHFLRICAHCTRRLIPGHDIYMYRGDSAFCSEECREHEMTRDERKGKCSLASKREVVANAAAVDHLSAAPDRVAAAV